MQQCGVDTLSDQSDSPKLNEMLRQSSKGSWSMWELYLQPTTLEETLEQISVIASNQGKENPSAAIMEIRTIVDDLMLPKRT